MLDQNREAGLFICVHDTVFPALRVFFSWSLAQDLPLFSHEKLKNSKNEPIADRFFEEGQRIVEDETEEKGKNMTLRSFKNNFSGARNNFAEKFSFVEQFLRTFLSKTSKNQFLSF